MKVVNTDRTYRIYGDDLKVHDQLPADIYIVRFSKMQGFFLEKYSGLEVKEEKIYGVHLSKVNKVIRSFKDFKRNLGVVLSGDKGIGKSLFARILCQSSITNGLPVIVVDTFIPGIHSFLEEIEQEVAVLFDEFDKTFSSGGQNDEQSPQTSMLSLLDGVSSGKKLFIVTCNKIHGLNDYLINRPGRFHYHFRFKYPTASEVKTYLQDKIKKEYWSEIKKVINFSGKVDLNYDCLRAIAYELNNGERFEDAIDDLNIINLNDQLYDVTLAFEDGTTAVTPNQRLNVFSKEKQKVWLKRIEDVDTSVEFASSDIKFDEIKNCSIIEADKVKVDFHPEDEEEEEIAKKLAKKQVKSLIISRKEKSNYYQYAI